MKHLFIGLVLAGLGLWGVIAWWNVFGLVMRGVVPFGLLMLGLAAIISGYRRGTEASDKRAEPKGPRAEVMDLPHEERQAPPREAAAGQ